jgi:hypothetical protein
MKSNFHIYLLLNCLLFSGARMMYELSPTPEKQEEALSIATCLSPKLQGITLSVSFTVGQYRINRCL